MLVKHEGKYLALKTLSKQQIMDMGLQVLCCTVLAPSSGAAATWTASIQLAITHLPCWIETTWHAGQASAACMPVQHAGVMRRTQRA